MNKKEIKVGDTIENLVVLELLEKSAYRCMCLCEDKTICIFTHKNLIRKHSKKHCGCLTEAKHRKKKDEDVVGRVYGILKILQELPGELRPNGRMRREVLAECLKKLGGCGCVKRYRLENLKAERNTISCGDCNYKKEKIRKTHTKHGLRNHLLYARHRQMMERVYNPACKQFKTYGDLYVEDYLQNLVNYVTYMTDSVLFPNWEEEVAAGKTVDRIDNTKGYVRGNLRYLTTAEQNRNTSRNVWIFFKGSVLCFRDACKKSGINSETVGWRVEHGWSIGMALTFKDGRPGYRPKNYSQPLPDIFFISDELVK